MKASRITEDEIKELKISSLPTRPTAPTAFGGKGYTPSQMKAAFDKLPLFIVNRYNALIDSINATDTDSVSENIMTGIKDGHSLAQLFRDIASGEILNHILVGDVTLYEYLTEMKSELELLALKLGEEEATA